MRVLALIMLALLFALRPEPGRAADIELDGWAGKKHAETHSGPVRIELRYGETPGDAELRFPVLDIYVDGARVGGIEDGGNGFEWPAALAQLVEMDKSNPYPEVTFSTFSGGAHCCNILRVVTSSADGESWHIIEADPFDGDLAGAEDVDGDGVFEIVHVDNRFLYKFASYAGSWAPLRMFALNGRRLEDVTRAKRYLPAHRAFLSALEIETDSIGAAPERNGFLAAYVATRSLVGEWAEGWEFMLANYDRKSDWGLNECTGGFDDDDNCLGETDYPDFPTALAAFLKATGHVRQGGRCGNCAE